MSTLAATRGQHRAVRSPLRLTRHGRIVWDLIAGVVVLGVAVFAQPISLESLTAVVWAGDVAGVSA